jgi:hypothetical protein
MRTLCSHSLALFFVPLLLKGHTAIVTTLKRYGTVDIDFLANQIGRGPNEVNGYVKSLENAGAIHRQDGMVSLTSASYPNNWYVWLSEPIQWVIRTLGTKYPILAKIGGKVLEWLERLKKLLD